MIDTEKKSASTVDPKIINCFKQALVDCFSSIYGSTPEYNENYITLEENQNTVMGIISIIGDGGTWSFMLGLPQVTAVPLITKFAGFSIDFESPDIGDAVGELANVVAGDITAKLSNIGIKANISLPSIARGKDIEILKTNNQTYTKMHFSVPDGKFWICIISGQIKK